MPCNNSQWSSIWINQGSKISGHVFGQMPHLKEDILIFYLVQTFGLCIVVATMMA